MSEEKMTEEKMRLEPDVLTPGSMAFLVDSRDKVVLQHGGSVTKIDFDRVEQMPVDYFLEHVVEQLKERDRTLTLLRDSVSGTYATILGDQVLRYHVLGVEECKLDDVIRQLRTQEDMSLSFNIQYPLVSYVQSHGLEHVTVELPPGPRPFRSRTFNVDTTLYLPPMWLRASFNAAGAREDAFIAVAPERSLQRAKTRLYKLPLPNNWEYGRICFGSVSFEQTGEGGKKSLGERIQGTVDMLFSSDWNGDLLRLPDDQDLARLAMGIVDDRVKNMRAGDDFKNLLKILGTPTGWQKLDYTPLTTTVKEFTQCGNL